MKLRIEVDIFSGRKNPVIELEEKEAEEAISLLKPREGFEEEARLPPISTLGYRGMIVEQVTDRRPEIPQKARVAAGVLSAAGKVMRIQDTQFEDFILSTIKPSKLPEARKEPEFFEVPGVEQWSKELREPTLAEEFGDYLAQEISSYRQRIQDREYMMLQETADLDLEAAAIDPSRIIVIKPKCRCAPLYEPRWWNDGGQIQYNNNCYNYSCNYRTDNYAQPGYAAGAQYQSLTCPDVTAAAVKDRLIDTPGANNRCPSEGHLVALVMAPGWDYHWYRLGRYGYWSHKPGGTPVTNRDNSNKRIPDPRSADRGPYTQFCTFMVVMHGHIKIKGPF